MTTTLPAPRRYVDACAPMKTRTYSVAVNQPIVTMTSEEVWARLEADPAFNESMRQAEADLAAGKGTPFSELRRQESSWWRRLLRLIRG